VLFALQASSRICTLEYIDGEEVISPWRGSETLSSDEGSLFIRDRAEFDLLAGLGELPGAQQISEVKFLVTDVRTDSPRLYFINSDAYQYHWKFFTEALEWNMDLLSFNTRTYTDFNRRLIAGSVVRYDSFSDADHPDGVYSIEFWPSDPIHAEEAALVLSLLEDGMPFAGDMLIYHPTGETQVRIHRDEADRFERLGVEVVQTAELYRGISYAALNTGIACGILRSGETAGTWSSMDIVVFQTIPNDISHVAGVITTIPQTPLSHINLKAIQNGTPNVYIQDFTGTGEYRSLLNRYVRLTALPGGYLVEAITLPEAIAWLDSVRPEGVTVLQGDFTQRGIRPIEFLRLADSDAYGAKAANLGELFRCLPSRSLPQGYAIPFSYYREYMEYNGFFGVIDSLTALEEFQSSAESRDEILARIRRIIRGGNMPPWMMDSLTVMASGFEPDLSLRCRSSTNNEDLPGFNGAGLYESRTHHPEEGHISETIRQVWAGMWTYRAYEEREFHRIDHNSAAMGVVVHPSFTGEIANGVAVTRNIINPFITGYYVNVQAGDDLVTNPEPESVPEEFLITRQIVTGTLQMELQYIASSNRVPEGERILSPLQILRLSEYLEDIHRHYADLHGVPRDDPYFAMEIEFKITEDGVLVVKQARPWVNGNG